MEDVLPPGMLPDCFFEETEHKTGKEEEKEGMASTAMMEQDDEVRGDYQK